MSEKEKKVILVDQFAELSAAVTRALPRDLTTDVAQGWITNPEALKKVLRELLLPPKKIVAPDTTPSRWPQFLAALIRACNFVSYVNPSITGENFPYREGDLATRPVEVISVKEHLRELGKSWLPTADVVTYLAKLGFRPATLVELLFWWLQNPAKWSDCLVVALGSSWRGGVPYVYGSGSNRELYLNSTENDWYGGCGFAAVRKSR